ncbi:MAG: hypothetical protein GX752_01550 [Clostridium sp.]|nr:hypothetical protein [Clostridium sp.]
MKGQKISNIAIIIFVVMIVLDRFVFEIPNIYYNLVMILVIIMLIVGIFKSRKFRKKQ